VTAEPRVGTRAPLRELVVQAGGREIGRIEDDRLDLSPDVDRRVDRRLVLAARLVLRLDI
jgi:hypothetical protein